MGTRFFDRQFSLAILFICIPLLFLPKINLITLDSGESAGLRIDDLILFSIAIVLMWGHIISYQRLYKIEGSILLLTFFSLFSFLMNHLLVALDFVMMDAKIFYAVRLFEYFLFFYIGALASHFFNDRLILRTFLIWNLALMMMQKVKLIGGMISTGYEADVSSRVPGIASFPSEMGLLLNLLFCYFIFDDRTTARFLQLFDSPFIRYLLHKIYLYGMFCLFGIFIIFTGNRISIVALFICFIFRIKQDLNFRSIGSYLSILILIPIVATAIGFTMTQTLGVYKRSANLFSMKNIELFSLVWDSVDIKENPMGNETLESKHYDMSWYLRLHKWLFMIKSYLNSPECYLEGLGPGYAGAALDGGILRIITEYGLIGAYLFWRFFKSLYTLNLQAKWMVIAFMINMIFFDAYLAYKTMSLLLFSCGYIFEKKLAHKSSTHPFQQVIPHPQSIGYRC